MKKETILFILTIGSLYWSISLSSQQIIIKAKWGDTLCALHKEFPSEQGHITFSTLRFYLSGVKVYKQKELLGHSVKPYNLVDFSNRNTTTISLDSNKDWDVVEFTLGIDSLSHYMDSYEGDLDPIKGMYWSWQSGFIHLKLEGIGKDSIGKPSPFQYHLGGFTGPTKAWQTIRLERKMPETSGILILDMQAFSRLWLQSGLQNLMRPTTEAVKLMSGFAEIISLQ